MATSVLSSSSASTLSRRPSSSALLDSRPSSHPSEGRSSSTTNSTNNTNGPVLLTTAQSTNKTILPQAGDVLSIEVQARNPRRRFPLSPEFLPQVTISREHIELLKRQCLVEMNRVLRKSNAVWAQSEQMFDGGEQEWRSHCTSKAHKMTLFRRKREDGTPAMRHFLARGQVANVTLADLEYGLYCDTTTDERAVKTDLYRELFLDAAVLQVFERQRPEDPFHFYGLKWLAYVSPADKFLSPRDYAFVEYSRTVETQAGEKLLIKVMVPVDSDIVSILPEREYDLVRGAMACTYMYKYDAAARAIQVFAEGSLDPSGSATSWMGKSFLTLLAPTIVNLENCADVKHFMKHGRVLSTDDFFTKVKEAKTSEAHKHCCACLKRFGSSLRKKTHASCRCCGQFMCSKCVISFTLCLPWHEKRDAEHPSAVREEKFCLKCVCLVRAHRNDAKHHAQLPTSTTVNQTSVDAVASQMSRINFENAPLPSREVVEEAHNAHTRFAGSRFVEERLRQMKERHLVRDKHRNNNQDPAQYPHQQPGQAEAFGRMEQSIAEQEELLRNLQYEHARREYQQRVAHQQYRQQTQLQAQQQYYLEHAAALSSSQRSIRASQAGWKPTASGMTNASISSSAYTADTFESSFDESDDDVFSISEDSDIYSPKRYGNGVHHSGSGRGMPPRSGQRHAGFV